MIVGAGYPYRPGTWALEWCWPCHKAHPDEPVHDETECPRRADPEAD